MCRIVQERIIDLLTVSHPTSDYATNHLALSPTDGAASVALISGLSAIGRVVSTIACKCDVALTIWLAISYLEYLATSLATSTPSLYARAWVL